MIQLNSDDFKVVIDKSGYVTELVDIRTGDNYCANYDTIAPLLSIRVCNEILYPQSASYNEAEQLITLGYKDGLSASVKTDFKSSHICFEVLSVSDVEKVELVIWGPFPTRINKVIGETIGVVQGDSFAIGLQALNIKTIGGYPWRENDYMPQLDVMEQDNYENLEKGKRGVLYSVEAAKPTAFGSTLQAFCRNRSTDRVIEMERRFVDCWGN
ncbi:MAG: hypothetical protein JEZ14_09600 [Marinilabiliaceae bacterium]|nr:hypothetical protein [Marinilabiliaceae bacterium]